MQILEAYQPFEIQEIQLDYWRQRPVKNNFFELVLIKTGRGTQCINYNEYPYEEGSIFLLPPLKCHSFQIEASTKFIFLKFSAAFFILMEREWLIKGSGLKKRLIFYPIRTSYREILFTMNWIGKTLTP